MSYLDLLDFNNQQIVDGVYERIKAEETNEELDKAYREITERNHNLVQTTQYQYRRIMDKISQLLGIIGMLIFAFSFIIGGSLVLSSVIFIIHLGMGEGQVGNMQTLAQWGMSIYDTLFASMAGSTAAEIIKNDSGTIMGFYILAVTTILIVIFVIVFIWSALKKDKKAKKEVKSARKLTLEQSYHDLQVSEDDTWSYIHKSFEKRIIRKNKDFYERYYQAYICIFENYQNVEGDFKMLLPKQKVVLVVRTFLNTSKNILSTLTMPLFLSGVVVWNVIRMVGESDQFVIKTLFSMSSLGTWFYEFMEKCYGFVMKTPLAFLVGNGKNEVSYFSAFCVVVSLIYIAYALYKERIGESIRQYHRRMNYYLKMNQGIYMENKKYSKVYRFTTGFIVLVFAIGVYIGLEHIYQVNPYAGMPEEVQISAKENLPIRDKKYIALEKYAKGKKHYIATLNEPRDLYLKYDVIKEKKNSQEPYLMMRTYPLEADAKEDMKYFRNGAGIHWKHHKKLNIDYYISKDGFVIRDHSIIIVMQNTRYFATPYGCIQPLSKEISLKDIKSFVKKLGYNL